MKKLIIALAIIVVLGLTVSLILGSLLGQAVTAGVNSYGPRLTGTEVTLGGAHLSPLTGSGTLVDLQVGNPPGFSAGKAFSVGKAHVAVRPLSLLGDTIEINDIVIAKPEFNYETTLFSSNIGKILDEVKKAGGATTPATGGEEPAKKVIIHHFLLEDAVVKVTVAGASLTVPLPRLELSEIGTAKGGVTPAEASAEILRQVLAAVLESAKKGISSGVGLGDRASDAAKKVGEAVKDLFKGEGP